MKQLPSYHLAGVAGAGMSALAQALLARGFLVSGSDRSRDTGRESGILDKLRRAGVELTPQDGSGIKPWLTAAVFSSAVERDNPDFRTALRLKIPIACRADTLAALAHEKRMIAVAGTSGKTTVTGMIGWILEKAGADPTVINGGSLLNWHDADSIGNMRAGRSDLWVVEADESDRSLMSFEPEWAVVTNISKDHFEVSEAEALFKAFAEKAKRGVVGCLCEKGDLDIIRNFRPSLTANGSAFEHGGVPFTINLPGAHNAENALQSAMLCERLGVSPLHASRALAAFKGIQRRIEVVGEARGITVIDDYAHNPAKINAAWSAVKPFHERVVAVWRPHGYGPLAGMADELIDTFSALAGGSDLLYVMPVYFAGGTARKTVSSETFVKRLAGKGVNTEFVSGYRDLLDRLHRAVRPGDAALFMGARDPDLPVFSRRFLAELRHLSMKRSP